MADPTAYKFSHKELVEALIKKQDLHDVIWQLGFEFSVAGGSFPFPVESTAPSPQPLPPGSQRMVLEHFPGTALGVVGVNLRKVEREGNMAVDAAKVNPMKRRE